MDFQGFPKEMIDFFMEIRLHNDVSFFEANRSRYEQDVKEPLQALAVALGPVVSAIDPRLDLRPARAVSRIRRDTRFTKDKSPDRDHMWIGWRRLGEERMTGVGLYFEISPEEVHWGCGVYSDQRDLMIQIRKDLVEHPKKYQKLLKEIRLGERFALHGNMYKRLAVPESLPDALRSLYLSKGFYVENISRPDDFELCFTRDLVGRLTEDYQMLTPLYQLMREQEAIAWITNP